MEHLGDDQLWSYWGPNQGVAGRHLPPSPLHGPSRPAAQAAAARMAQQVGRSSTCGGGRGVLGDGGMDIWVNHHQTCGYMMVFHMISCDSNIFWWSNMVNFMLGCLFTSFYHWLVDFLGFPSFSKPSRMLGWISTTAARQLGSMTGLW